MYPTGQGAAVGDILVWDGTKWASTPRQAPASAYAEIAADNFTTQFGPTDAVWALPTSTFVAMPEHGSDWTFNATTGVMTYSGASRKFEIGAEFSPGVLGGAADISNIQVYGAISYNGDMIGSDFATSPPFYKGNRGSTNITSGPGVFISAAFPMTIMLRRTIGPGDTLGVVAAGLAAAGHVIVSAVVRLWAIPRS